MSTIMRWGVLVIVLASNFSCSDDRLFEGSKSQNYIPELAMTDTEIIGSLKQHCSACHKAGSNRFIFEDKSPKENMKWLRSTRAKLASTTYAESIRSTLLWPGDRVPKNSDRVDQKRRYMPFGAAKSAFHAEKLRGSSLRTALIENL